MPIRIRNQLGLSFWRTPENVSSRHGWFLSNFSPNRTNYPPFLTQTLYIQKKKNKKKVPIPNIFDTCHRYMEYSWTIIFQNVSMWFSVLLQGHMKFEGRHPLQVVRVEEVADFLQRYMINARPYSEFITALLDKFG